MAEIPSSDNWLRNAAMRLQSDMFVPLPEQGYQAAGFRFAVRRTRFELTKFGMAETFFVFADIPNLTPEIMTNFSAAAFRYAISSRAIPLPCGILGSAWCFAVAITNNINAATAELVKRTAPPKHWGAGEMAVIYDVATSYLYFFEGTPVWGAAYFDGFRQQIRQYLG